jgi:mutator protein MutT
MAETTMKHFVSVCGVILDEERRLLLTRRRDNKEWEPPGGRVEKHETIEEALIREVDEETGITVAIERLTGVYKNMPRSIVTMVFLCSPLSGTIRCTEETTDVLWIGLDEAMPRLTPIMAARVSKSLGPLEAFVGAHDGLKLI